MADLKIRTEVFEAALKNPGPLAALIRSGDPLNERTRIALAMFLEGRLLLLDKRPGGSRKFSNWDDFIHSPHARAALLVEFEELTHEQAAEKALRGEYRPGAAKATKQQLIDYLGKSKVYLTCV